jgi:hypothetical protein
VAKLYLLAFALCLLAGLALDTLTSARLLRMLLTGILAYALSGCAATQPEAFNHAAETAAPTAATR